MENNKIYLIKNQNNINQNLINHSINCHISQSEKQIKDEAYGRFLRVVQLKLNVYS